MCHARVPSAVACATTLKRLQGNLDGADRLQAAIKAASAQLNARPPPAAPLVSTDGHGAPVGGCARRARRGPKSGHVALEPRYLRTHERRLSRLQITCRGREAHRRGAGSREPELQKTGPDRPPPLPACRRRPRPPAPPLTRRSCWPSSCAPSCCLRTASSWSRSTWSGCRSRSSKRCARSRSRPARTARNSAPRCAPCRLDSHRCGPVPTAGVVRAHQCRREGSTSTASPVLRVTRPARLPPAAAAAQRPTLSLLSKRRPPCISAPGS